MIDERKGVVKAYWQDVRDRVAVVRPEFAKIVDELSVDQTFPVYLMYYPYGALSGDTESPILPLVDGGSYRLTDPNAPKDIVKHLGYGKERLPLAMLLEKEIEFFVDLIGKRSLIPSYIYSPGAIFPLSCILSMTNKPFYAPNGVLTTSSGVRSAFMLPNVGILVNHLNLRRDFGIKSRPPRSLHDHWHLFKEIVHSEAIKSDWRSCILYFSEKWVTKLHTDKAWLPLKLHLHELAWMRSEYQRNNSYYEVVFASIQRLRNLKANSYLADTARHLFAIALGAAPAYVPACDNEALPLDILQQVFVESYGLKKYPPTIMRPAIFNFEQDKLPIYYSLNQTAHRFSPGSSETRTTLFDMRELEHLMRVFLQELTKENAVCSDTVIGELVKRMTLTFFHTKADQHRVASLAKDTIQMDPRFGADCHQHTAIGAIPASDAQFFKGCVSISTHSFP